MSAVTPVRSRAASRRARWDRSARLAVALLAVVAACVRPAPVAPPVPPVATVIAPDVALQRRLDPRPVAQGLAWLGGDVAASVALGDGRSIWLYGDTLLGTLRTSCPDDAPYCDRVADLDDFIANSVGTMPPVGPVDFYWGRGKDGAAASVFSTREHDEFLWPLAVVRLGDQLLIAANRHTRAAFLTPVGNEYLVVADARGPPSAWSVSHHDVPGVAALNDPRQALTWTTALVPAGRHVYVVGQLGVGFYARTVLARLERDAITRPGWQPRLEYLLHDEHGGTTWSFALDVDRLHDVEGLPGTTEATFDYYPERGWLTYRLAPFGDAIHQYSASSLDGPWHDDGVAYTLPAPWSGPCHAPAEKCPGGGWIAYGVKSHPELALSGQVVLTYNVNLLNDRGGDSAPVLRNEPGFYVPRIVSGPPLPSPR